MLSDSRFVVTVLVAGLVLLVRPSYLLSQEATRGSTFPTQSLPEAPQPQIDATSIELHDQPDPVRQDQPVNQLAEESKPAQVSVEKSQLDDGVTNDKSKKQKADEQIKQQEHQRVLGIIPSFNTSYVSDAVSLTPTQKLNLAFHSAVDPYTFAIAFIVAGLGEAKGDDSGFGWGPEGYFKRSGASYLDAFDGTMIGNAVLPIVLHQDPRYFRLGHGRASHRLLYAVTTSFICKHDNSGKWEPNYSNIGGNIISGAISNLYYPNSKSGVAQTFEAGLTVTFEGTFGATLQEFWPDISRKLFHKDPTNGLDAQARAADETKKKPKINQQ